MGHLCHRRASITSATVTVLLAARSVVVSVTVQADTSNDTRWVGDGGVSFTWDIESLSANDDEGNEEIKDRHSRVFRSIYRCHAILLTLKLRKPRKNSASTVRDTYVRRIGYYWNSLSISSIFEKNLANDNCASMKRIATTLI